MNEKNQLVNKVCNLCGSESYSRYYEQKDHRFEKTPRDTFRMVKCGECGLIYLNPAPTKTYMKYFYPDTFYDFRAFPVPSRRKSIRDFLEIASPINLRSKLALKEKTDLVKRLHKHPGKLLDVGAAEGNFLLAMKKNGWDVLGVEISKSMADFASEKYGITYINDDLNNLSIRDFKTKDFDIITMWRSFVHMYDPKAALQLCNQILKPNGKIIIMSTNSDSVEEKLFRRTDPNLIDVPRHLYHVNPDIVKKYFEVTGFKFIKTFYFSLNITSRLTIITNSKLSRMRKKYWFDKLIWLSAANLSLLAGILFSLLLSIFKRSYVFTIIGMKQDTDLES
ncbi:MAG: class I SAM-dependent methyltransferase [bacterium]|nr:MAG: class I SAM-dependent methyltransferase [bacterium]